MKSVLVGSVVDQCIAAGAACCLGDGPPARVSDFGNDIAAPKARIGAFTQRTAAPALGHQMLELQIRHDRL